MKKLNRLFVLFVCLAHIMTGCGGGGSSSPAPDDGVNNESKSIETLLTEENIDAKQFTELTINYAKASNELLALLEENGLASSQEALTPEQITDQVGEENITPLLNAMDQIIGNRLIPMAAEMLITHERLMATEQQIGLILEGEPQTQRFLGEAAIAAGLILTVVGVGVACHNEIVKHVNACFAAVEAEHSSQQEPARGALISAGKLECIAYNIAPAFEECADDAAIAVGLTAVSGGTGALGLKTAQITTDVVSTAGSIDTLVGMEGSCDPPQTEPRNMRATTVSSDESVKTYFGTSENGKLLIPEGNWSFLMFRDGYARSVTECVDISGDEDPIVINLEMVPIEEVAEKIVDNDNDGFTELEGDCDDQNNNIYPTATETCNDGLDNNCDSFIDCADGSCANEQICQDAPVSDTTTIQLTVNIPGYSGPFAPTLSLAGLAQVDGGPNIYPALQGLNELSPYTNDLFSIFFSNTLSGPGTYTVSSTDFDEGGTASILFSSPDIVDEDSGQSVVFSSVSGTVTLESYGLTSGEQLKGNFSVGVEGKQDLCVDLQCDETWEKAILGAISGSFDGKIIESQ